MYRYITPPPLVLPVITFLLSYIYKIIYVIFSLVVVILIVTDTSCVRQFTTLNRKLLETNREIGLFAQSA